MVALGIVLLTGGPLSAHAADNAGDSSGPHPCFKLLDTLGEACTDNYAGGRECESCLDVAVFACEMCEVILDDPLEGGSCRDWAFGYCEDAAAPDADAASDPFSRPGLRGKGDRLVTDPVQGEPAPTLTHPTRSFQLVR